MFHIDFKSDVQTMATHVNGLVVALILGNLAGFITVITLTWLLRFIPLHIAFPVTTGLAVLGVQVIAGMFLFGESISLPQWLGTTFVVSGIILLSGK
jgi:multidrug transporter EmrE-like cation transporter